MVKFLMDSFLRASKSYMVNLVKYEKVRVVMGNPTCDLDSAVCALVYAFQQYKESKDRKIDIAVTALFNIPEREFRLKTEVVYHFEKHNVPLELLTFRDQLNLEDLSKIKKLEIVLVDHHTLPEEDLSLADSVIEIIDHRPQDPAWLWPGKTMTLELVGSCATLIARNLLENELEILDPTVCSLLRGPILVDTANFSKQANKATPTDVEVAQRLEEIGFITTDRELEYKEILYAKTDISRLSPDDLLIRDLKVTNGIPISGLPILVQKFVTIQGAFEALNIFTARYKRSVAVVMGLDLSNNVVTRDIAIFSLNANELHGLIEEKLNACVDPLLNLSKIQEVYSDYKFTLFSHGNIQASRKQVLPIITSVSMDCPC